MTPREAERERLEAAISAAGFACVECGSDRVTLGYSPVLGWVPVIGHWRLARRAWYRRRKWCPCTCPGVAAARASLDLLDALVATVAVSSYGEPVWHRRERVSA